MRKISLSICVDSVLEVVVWRRYVAWMAHPEQSLISAILRTSDHLTPISNGISGDLFHIYEKEWQWLETYIVMRRRTPSRQAFRAKFPNFSILKVDDVEHFIDEVKQSHVKHSLISIVDDVANGIEVRSNYLPLVSEVHKAAINLQAQIEGSSAQSDIINNWDEIYSQVSERFNRAEATGLAGVPTGFDTLDERTGGPGPGDYWVIAGRLGQGKTWTGIRMACAAAFQGFSIQYFSLEQSKMQVALRTHTFMASEYGKRLFKHLDLQQGKNFDLIKYKKFLRGLQRHLPGSFYVSDSSKGQVSPLTIAAQIELNRPDIVYVDYLTLMERDGDDWTAVASLSSEIKNLTQRYNIPIVVLAQINRAGIGKEPPGPEHISQADRIGQDADAVVTIKKMSESVVKMRLAKYRHGQDGYQWWCRFSVNSGEYMEITGDEAQDLMNEDAML